MNCNEKFNSISGFSEEIIYLESGLEISSACKVSKGKHTLPNSKNMQITNCVCGGVLA